MTIPITTKLNIIRALDDLNSEHLKTLAEFIEFLRAKSNASSHVPKSRVVKLGGLWRGYSFSEEDIRAARREAWSSLGKSE